LLPRNVRTEETIEEVAAAYAISPKKSTRKAALELGIPRTTLQRILKNDLRLAPNPQQEN
jgi:hypothetical protein